MARLSILTGSLTTLQLPGLALRQKSQPVPTDLSREQLQALIAEMFACMYQVNGRGLAAPQVGVLWRLFVLDMQPTDGTPPLVLINPEIEDMDDTLELGREGCLSIPGYLSTKVPRARSLAISGYNHRFERVRYEVAGEVARGMQHEYDHLDGILYIDHLAAPEDLERGGDPWLAKATRIIDQLDSPAPSAAEAPAAR